MNQNNRKLESVICQLLATGIAEKIARRKALRQPDEQPLDERSFPSRDEMVISYMFAALDLDADLSKIMSAAADLPKPYGDMFCYLAYKDMHERMKTYQRLADELAQMGNDAPPDATPELVAVTA